MNPPFYGNKIVTYISLDDIYPFIDTHSLFVGRWQFKRTKGTEEAYQKILKEKAHPAFAEWKKRCQKEKLLEPKVTYGYFEAKDFKKPITDHRSQITDFTPLQLVTVGSKVAEKCHQLFSTDKYTDYLYLHGLAVETTEALAEFWHQQILKELGISLSAMSRISPGYPIWPDISVQKDIVRLLNAEKIGVTLTETYQLVPEYSTSAMIVI